MIHYYNYMKCLYFNIFFYQRGKRSPTHREAYNTTDYIENKKWKSDALYQRRVTIIKKV